MKGRKKRRDRKAIGRGVKREKEQGENVRKKEEEGGGREDRGHWKRDEEGE